MYFTGFADEAAVGIDKQIEAVKALGWSNIEARNIDKVNIHDLTDEQFDVVYGKLQDAGVSINCFGSTIANWGKKITDPFDVDLAIIDRAIPRMQKLGTKLIRIMSYAINKETAPDGQNKEERFKRLRIITDKFLQAGIQPLHENCMNYGGLGWSYTLEIIDNVPGLRLIFDTGNPVFNRDFTKNSPYPFQSSWEFYSAVRDYVDYIHIKDCKQVNNGTETEYQYPGEGDGDVRKVLKDAFERGYDGGISIEPHLAIVFHDSDNENQEDKMMRTYLEYGRRIEKLVAEIKQEIGK